MSYLKRMGRERPRDEALSRFPPAALAKTPRRARLVAILSALVYALSAAALTLPLAVREAVVAAAAGAGLGALIAYRIARPSLRLTSVVTAVGLCLAFVAAFYRLLLDWSWFASLVGPASALRGATTLFTGVAALLFALGLRSVALRVRLAAVFEVALVAVAFAQLVVAHREGAINRPFELADPMIAVGVDPTIALMAIGAAAALVIVLVLLVETNPLRLAVDVVVAAAAVAAVLYTARVVGLPQPAPDGLGLRSGQERKDDKSQRDKDGKPNAGGRRNNDDLDFRDDYGSPLNRAPIAVVLLHDDFSPPSGVYYFRQSAFSLFNGRRLVEAAGTDLDKDLAVLFPSARTVISEVPNQRGDRAVVDTTVALLADHKRPFALESPLTLEPSFNPDPARFRRIYRASSASLTSDDYALLGRPAGDIAWSQDTWRHYTDAPTDRRYRELAEQITGRLRFDYRQDAMARALAISTWLSKQGLYSLRSSHARAADPTADFLFGNKTGYCVHFSHAAVYMMRSLGLPTRIATGYVVEESARRGGSTIVLSGENSHSWPELYLRGVGWVVVDVVPERSLDPPPPPPDPDLQRLLGELVRAEKPLPYAPARMFEPAARLARQAFKTLVRAVGCVILLALFLLYLVKIWRRWAPAVTPTRRLPRVLYRAQLDRLSELHLRRRFGESRERFAARVAPVCPSFSPLTETHLRRVFGSGGAGEVSGLQKLAIQIKSELYLAIPVWRRIRGALTPWSWLGSR